MANPLGFLNTPTAENTKPRIHMTMLSPGAHDVNRQAKARINPVKPMPFFCLVSLT